uniref:Chorismate lyase n=1 Tax=Ceramothamnion japonicum TaxID=218448 RepID=A0A1C9CDA8_CERJP|nr:hypothetical protein Ceram_089 [Ceramium japonicum]AOM66365.1 hypothetical protein Ceram_089 [Ceramium japonicum]
MNINNMQLFHPIFTLKYSSKKYVQKNINKYIPIEWQFIVMNNGSLTQNLNSLLINQIQLEMSQKYNITLNNKLTNIRIVWLENYINKHLTFAQSIWMIDKQNNIYKHILNTQPIGYSLIQFEIDIYKDLQEIYCGYCYNLENIFDYSNLIWGRKYKMFYEKNSYVTIEEFFTPQLAKFLALK